MTPAKLNPDLRPRARLVPLALGAALATCSLLASSLAHAQTTPAPAKPATKPAPRPATGQPARPPARTPAPPPAPALPVASAEQMTAFEAAHFGDYACEFNESVKVVQHARHAGYVDVQHRKAVYTMKPVISSTGAIRLEDVRGRMLMLQIANKSMLMDTRLGQRLVDNCVHEKQREFANQPPGQSLGIAPQGAPASAPR